MGDVMERSAETDSCKGKPRSALTQQSETSQFTFFKDRLDCSVHRWLYEVRVEQRTESGGCCGPGERW